MLALTRRIQEKIIIGHRAEIEIVVLEIKGGQVKLGIKAAKDVPIDREEVYARKNGILMKDIPVANHNNVIAFDVAVDAN